MPQSKNNRSSMRQSKDNRSLIPRSKNKRSSMPQNNDKRSSMPWFRKRSNRCAMTQSLIGKGSNVESNSKGRLLTWS